MILGVVSIHTYVIKLAETSLLNLIPSLIPQALQPISGKYVCWFYQIQVMILGMVSINNYVIKIAETGLFCLFHVLIP